MLVLIGTVTTPVACKLLIKITLPYSWLGLSELANPLRLNWFSYTGFKPLIVYEYNLFPSASVSPNPLVTVTLKSAGPMKLFAVVNTILDERVVFSAAAIRSPAGTLYVKVPPLELSLESFGAHLMELA